MKRFFRILLSIVLIFIISYGGYCAYKYYNKTTSRVKENSLDISVSTDLFGKYYQKADNIVKGMSLEEKIGQIFLVRYDDNYANKYINNYHAGGFVFFGKDFEKEDKISMLAKINSKQDLSKIKLITAVDEEGGYVTRVSKYKTFRDTRFPFPQEIYKSGGYALLESTEKEKAELLLSIGINMNLAPVSDVSTDPNNFIYDRSFGSDAKSTATYVRNMVSYARNNHIASCLKHFPGYGNNVDTHTGIALDERSLDSFKGSDFLPFSAGIKAGVPAILVSHNIVKCMDENYPASLSLSVHKILRNDLNFTGIIITDDLAMDAVKSYVSNGEAASLALEAGNDLIITSDLESMYQEILTNIKNNKIDIKILNTAVRRIIAFKLAYKIIV